ncbi:biotin-dependent carboxyltransferase family protein [Vibrio salinus]|uniref:5-oxoprolinase subunit C family protein n=1 Tax=Vibrio salinus TaxID=2899784 RepID=UPI001E36AE9E|nr:biotin-dependent carboxyltransferase family protein [Vibrio salinus]MCE0496158.1 biotin-dependent carboxyltransferase family protein [Vibrio salinus]
MIEVLQAGPLTSVQDLGRQHFRDQGVALSGATDPLSLRVGNMLLGNEISAAGIEWMFGNGKVKFVRDTWFVVTGAECFAQLDQKPVMIGWRMMARAGQVLTLRTLKSGLCSYLCLEGGIDVPVVLGSRSTDLQSGFGGYAGRVLQKGDCISLFHTESAIQKSVGVLLPHNDGVIRVMEGPEESQFSPDAIHRFYSSPWRVKTESNRMGFRLDGPVLERMVSHELLSHGILPGIIQVPPEGKPIIIGVDGQTTGGYPRMASVIASDLWKIGQLRPGTDILFRKVTPEEAKHAYQEQQFYLNKIHMGVV